MRLSWYADSAVAVFSIWQGNRCTGTFRLPFGDLDRMIETLQSGPPSQSADANSRQAGAAFAGHPDGYPVTASYLAPGYPDQGYPGSAYPDRQAGPAGYPDRQPTGGYPRAAAHGGPGPQGPHDYRGAPAYHRGAEYHGAAEPHGSRQPVGAAEYLDRTGYGQRADYSDAGGYTDPHGYQGPAGYQEGGGYVGAPGYQDRLSYQDPGGRPNRRGYPDPPGQKDPGHTSPRPGLAARGYDDAPFEPATPASAFSQPVAAGEWLAAPTGGQMPGRHGTAHVADSGAHGPQSAGPPSDRHDSDWEAATAAYRAL
jgi:hypothetical protein